ncbi:MAG TPA: FABP family protein [Acidimicrobiales bacterium]|nr:FABP family protein [Acidimicrobiales bacterium]
MTHPLDVPALHPAIAPLGFLVGTWVGEGEGEYPTIEPFAYTEQITVSHVGKPFLAYAQRTWSADDGRPLHAETGYWRAAPGGAVELVVAHPTGHAELAEGTLAGHVVSVRTLGVQRTTSAKEVTAIARRLTVEGDHLHYELDMAAVGQPLVRHLRGTLLRVSAEQRA